MIKIKTPVFISFLCILSVSAAWGQSAPNSLSMDSILFQGPEYELIKPQTGHWRVIQTVFHMDGKTVLTRDTFRAARKMVGNFLEETMRPLSAGSDHPFKRLCYLNYNRTERRWEYIVLDTRYPLMMFETSTGPAAPDHTIDLYLSSFPIPPFWGPKYAGQLGKQHRELIFPNTDKMINNQYWTLPGRAPFLAIQYVYDRRP